MTTVKIKRIYDKSAPTDGYRVFIDKIWPRGMEKDKVKYNLWAKDLAPSVPLRKWFHEDPDSNWEGFEEKYMQELQISPAVKTFVEKIKNQSMVTLLYGSRNTVENHALVLQGYLEKVLN